MLSVKVDVAHPGAYEAVAAGVAADSAADQRRQAVVVAHAAASAAGGVVAEQCDVLRAGVAGDGAVNEREGGVRLQWCDEWVDVLVAEDVVRHPAAHRGGVAADGAVNERRRADRAQSRSRINFGQIHVVGQAAASAEAGRVAADRAAGGRERASVVHAGTIAFVGGVAADGTPGERQRADVEHATASVREIKVAADGVAADSAVGQRGGAGVEQAAAHDSVARAERQPREQGGDAPVDRDDPARVVAADRDARRRPRDRGRAGRVRQHELAGGQGDRLRRGERSAREGDGVGPIRRVRLVDRPAQAADAAIVEGVHHGERRRDRAILEGLDGQPSAKPRRRGGTGGAAGEQLGDPGAGHGRSPRCD